MKQLLIGFCMLLPVISVAQLPWSQEIAVAESADGAVRPRIVLTGDNIPLVFWGDGSPKVNRSARFNGTDFDPSIEVTPAGVQPFVTWWAGSEIAAQGDKVFAVIKSDPAEQGKVYVIPSNDGGQTWGDTVRVENIGQDLSRFPSVAITGSGNPVVTFMKFEPNWQEPHYVVAASTDGGSTFEPDVLAMDPATGEACDCCPAAMTANGEDVALIFRNNDNNVRDMHASISDDGGATFPLTGPVDDSGWLLQACPSSGADVLFYGNELLTVFMSGASGDDRSYISVADYSDLSNYTVTHLFPSAPAGAEQKSPRIAGSGDTLGVVWENRAGGQVDVFFSYSTTGPNGFSTPDTVNVQLLGSQRNPDIAYANGVFYISWQDDALGQVTYRSVDITGSVGIEHPQPAATTWWRVQQSENRISLSLDASIGGVTTVRLIDINGRLVAHRQAIAPTIEMATAGLAPGSYIVQFENNSIGWGSQKIIIR